MTRRMIWIGSSSALVVLLVGWGTLFALPRFDAEATTCDCYYACVPGLMCECTGDKRCNNVNSGCGLSGKKDGLCVSPPAPDPKSFSIALTLSSLEGFFDAYEPPLQNGEGRPDGQLLDTALAIQLDGDQAQRQQLIIDVVHEALDATIGFDFQMLPLRSRGYNGNGILLPLFGNIRGTPSDSLALVQAARTGLRDALKARNLNRVAPPLEAFWRDHADYHPFHTGRYYSHGHPDYDRRVGSPLAGQVAVLRAGAARLMNDGLPICGNNKREGSEACDGSDSAACSDCTSECQCPIIR